MIKRTLLLISLAAPTYLHAEAADYIIDGIFPGMSAQAAKQAGFTNCQKQSSDEIICTKINQNKKIFDIPTEYVQAVFEEPYNNIKQVDIKFNLIKSNTSKKTKNKNDKWADVVSSDDYYDLTATLIKNFGEPIKKNYWHKCKAYYLYMDNAASIIHLYYNPDQIELRKWECEQKNIRDQESKKTNSAAENFINKMK
ncbi:hypothetical protein ACMYR3_06075 [Ampullimonas aquatilis]|uniref:hypothetical protein n=1 Tax=Ampullimonas aquatilis TaxID=1341549 RepID=UPI003C70A334